MEGGEGGDNELAVNMNMDGATELTRWLLLLLLRISLISGREPLRVKPWGKYAGEH